MEKMYRDIHIRLSPTLYDKYKSDCRSTGMQFSSYIRLLLDLGYKRLQDYRGESHD